MNPRERAELVKTATDVEWSSRPPGAGSLEKRRGKQRLFVTQPPAFIRNKQGEIIGMDAWVQLFDETGRELPIDPHRRIINPPTVPRVGVVETPNPADPDKPTRVLTPDPLAAFWEAVWDSVEGTPNEKGWGTRGTVTTVFADLADGVIGSTDATYATARAGSALTVSTTNTQSVLGQDTTFAVRQLFESFDTSPIADTDVVSAVVLDMWLVTDNSTTDFTIEVRESDWGATLTTADWVAGASLSGLPLMASLSTNGIGATGAYKTFTSTGSFISAANLKIGVVHLLLCSDKQTVGTQPTTTDTVILGQADAAGTTQDPKLTITHAVASVPPRLISPYGGFF